MHVFGRSGSQELHRGFETRLMTLSNVYSHVLAQGEYCGWHAERHFEYLYIEHQYLGPHAPKTTTQSNITPRKMMFERMLMLMEEYSRQDLVVHEEALTALRFYKKQARHIHDLWFKQLATLANYVESVVEESLALQHMQLAKDDEQKRFDAVRLEMCQNLLKWKQQRMKEAKEAEEQKAKKDKLHAEWQKQEDARELQERNALKVQVKGFRNEQDRIVRLQQEEAERRADIAEQERQEQALVNVERVEYRKTVAEEKQYQLELLAEQKIAEEQAREERLAALRATVAVSKKDSSAAAIPCVHCVRCHCSLSLYAPAAFCYCIRLFWTILV